MGVNAMLIPGRASRSREATLTLLPLEMPAIGLPSDVERLMRRPVGSRSPRVLSASVLEAFFISMNTLSGCLASLISFPLLVVTDLLTFADLQVTPMQ